VRAEYVGVVLPDEISCAPLVRTVPAMIACPHDNEVMHIVSSSVQCFVMLFDVIIRLIHGPSLSRIRTIYLLELAALWPHKS
jgi:hypothetical protein